MSSAPSSAWTTLEVRAWLRERDVEFDPSDSHLALCALAAVVADGGVAEESVRHHRAAPPQFDAFGNLLVQPPSEVPPPLEELDAFGWPVRYDENGERIELDPCGQPILPSPPPPAATPATPPRWSAPPRPPPPPPSAGPPLPDINARRIFVRPLAPTVAAADLEALAAPLGVLVSGSVQVHHPPPPTNGTTTTRDLRDEALVDRDRHTNDGWGFATFRSEDDARRAAALLRSVEFHGRVLCATLARPRPERAAQATARRDECVANARAARGGAGAAVVTVRGSDAQVARAVRELRAAVDGAAVPEGAPWEPGLASAFTIVERSRGIVRLELAAARVGAMLGKGGATISAVRKASGARVAVEAGSDAERAAFTRRAERDRAAAAEATAARAAMGAAAAARRKEEREARAEAQAAKQAAAAHRAECKREEEGWRRRAAKTGCAEAAAAAFAALKAAREAAGRGREAVREARSALGKAQTACAAARAELEVLRMAVPCASVDEHRRRLKAVRYAIDTGEYGPRGSEAALVAEERRLVVAAPKMGEYERALLAATGGDAAAEEARLRMELEDANEAVAEQVRAEKAARAELRRLADE